MSPESDANSQIIISSVFFFIQKICLRWFTSRTLGRFLRLGVCLEIYVSRINISLDLDDTNKYFATEKYLIFYKIEAKNNNYSSTTIELLLSLTARKFFVN